MYEKGKENLNPNNFSRGETVRVKVIKKPCKLRGIPENLNEN